ncbi:hypothetical protein HKD37_09G025256 [Glycine soja]
MKASILVKGHLACYDKRVSTCTTTEEMWDLIQVIDEGTPDATKRNYWRCPKRFNHIVNNLKGLGKVFEEGESNWEQQSHPHNQHEERLSNLENVLMQFMRTSLANFKANQKSIHNLDIQLGKLAKEMVEIRGENSNEVEAHEESLEEEQDSRENGEQDEDKDKRSQK